MAVKIQLRGDTKANWLLANPVISEREMVLETDTGKYKIGDGVKEYADLSYHGIDGKPSRITDDGFWEIYNPSTDEYVKTSHKAVPTDVQVAVKTNNAESVRFKDITVATTLTNLPVENYSIKVTLSAASALSFASTPAEGWECMIDIKNTGSSDITQALPNATGWQCDEDSITIAAGKIASISVRYVHGVYVVLSRGN